MLMQKGECFVVVPPPADVIAPVKSNDTIGRLSGSRFQLLPDVKKLTGDGPFFTHDCSIGDLLLFSAA